MNPRRLGIFCAWVLVVSGAFASSAFAATATVGPVTIDIPAGFTAAGSQSQASMQVAGWTKGTGTAKTRLQVSIYDFGSALKGASSEKDLADGAQQYLLEFLKGIERRRTDYSQSPVERLKLAGLPAARSTWKGRAGDVGATGTMYCVIVNKRIVVSLHTQDAGNAPTAAMREAMKAFEAMRIAP
jgi:hypothetical protein